MLERQRQLLESIEAAFANVQLGEGVSLHETEVLDMYGSDEERLAARSRDEQHDWRRLIHSPDLIEVCGIGGLSFYDPEGLRFHLPAYLSRVVTNPLEDQASSVFESLIFTLTSLSDYQLERLSILNADQRHCCGDVLEYVRDVWAAEWDYDGTEINSAVKQYWSLGMGSNHGDLR